MLVKRNILISTLFLISLLTKTTTADVLKCSNGHCQVDVTKLAPSKNMKQHKISKFKNIDIKFTPLEESLVVKEERLEFDKIYLDADKYVQQDNEQLEPLTQEEENTIIPAPEKFVATPEEHELYLKQQRAMGLEEIELTLPMPLYYCLDDKEPIYDEKERQFNCIVSG